MPVALSTTKRKFHKVLDSISNASSVSLVGNNQERNASTTNLPTNMEPPSKRLRIARPVSAYVKSSTTTPMTKIRPLSVVQKPPAKEPDSERKPPNFAPWDRNQFLERLKTYRHIDKWRGKSEKISEVQWAKRGWSCVGRETVGCVGGCGKELVILLESRENKENLEDKVEDQKREDENEDEDEDEDDWREKAREQLIDKYAEMIVTAHNEGCMWRRRGCDDTIQRLPLAHQAKAVEDLRQRYTSLLPMSSEIPPNPSIPDNLNPSEIHDQLLPLLHPPHTRPPSEPASDPAAGSAPPSALDSPAMLLALFGWKAEEGHIKGVVTCKACFRRLGLWLFNASSDAAPASMERLDVIGEHRDYCPWINPLAQNGAVSRRTSLDGLAGWQGLVRAVEASAMHKKHISEEVPPATPTKPSEIGDDAASAVDTSKSVSTPKEDRKDRDEKDKERWAKLKRLKQVFHVKRTKAKDQVVGSKMS